MNILILKIDTLIGIKISQETKNKYIEAKRNTYPIRPDLIAKIDFVFFVLKKNSEKNK